MTCEQDYLNRYPDIAGHSYFKLHPKEHYDNHGKAEGRIACDEWRNGGGNTAPSSGSCEQDYLNRYPDIAGHPHYSNNPKEHYDQHGRNEGRIACAEWQGGNTAPTQPSGSCEQDYLNRYPDVAAHPYFGKHPKEHYDNNGKAEGRIACAEWRGDSGGTSPQPPTSSGGITSGLPKRRIMYIDDSVRSLTSDQGGDYNAPNDAAFVIALFQHYGYSPMALGATCVGNNEGVEGSIFRRMLDAAGFAEVPVKVGSPTYNTARSDLSRYIVEESRKGPMTICIGGPCNDVTQAIKDGAVLGNITFSVILRGTWNEWTNPNTEAVTRANTKYLYDRTRDIFDVTWYRDLLRAPKGIQWNEDWIANWKSKNEMFNIGFGNFVNEQNRIVNNMQGSGRNPMRVADFMTVDRVFGGQNRAANFDQVIARVERGLNLINVRLS